MSTTFLSIPVPQLMGCPTALAALAELTEPCDNKCSRDWYSDELAPTKMRTKLLTEWASVISADTSLTNFGLTRWKCMFHKVDDMGLGKCSLAHFDTSKG